MIKGPTGIREDSVLLKLNIILFIFYLILTDYVPPVEAEVVTRRKAMPLDENEGIYIRDIKSGKVRAIIGETYMLNQDEELWEKALPAEVERLLTKDALADKDKKETAAEKPRNKSNVVTYRVPHNGAVQIYDYKEKKARLVNLKFSLWIFKKFYL